MGSETSKILHVLFHKILRVSLCWSLLTLEEKRLQRLTMSSASDCRKFREREARRSLNQSIPDPDIQFDASIALPSLLMVDA